MTDASRPPLVTLEGFNLTLGPRTLLHDISCSIEDRGVHVLLGPGGAGKSTLLRVIAQAHFPAPPWRMTGRLDHHPPLAVRGPALMAQKERPGAPTLLEALFPPADTRRPDAHDCAARLAQMQALHVPTAAHVEPHLRTPVEALPPGILALGLVAATFLQPTPLVCLDEPTTDVEGVIFDTILALIEAQAGQRAVVLVTHHIGVARRLASKVTLLTQGLCVASCDANAFFEHPPNVETGHYLRTGGLYLPLDERDAAATAAALRRQLPSFPMPTRPA